MRGRRRSGWRARLAGGAILAAVLALASGAPGCGPAAKKAVAPGSPAAVPAPAKAPEPPTPPPAPPERRVEPPLVPPGESAAQASQAPPEGAPPGGAPSPAGPVVAEGPPERPAGSEPAPAPPGGTAGPEAGGEAAGEGAGAAPPPKPAAGNGSGASPPRAKPELSSRRGNGAPDAAHAVEPAWARGKEDLRFRIRFLGATVGHATFTFRGKVMLDGKEAYLLSVRAETTGSLSLIYPVRQAIDYYIDPVTLAPVLQEYLVARRGKDDQVIYDQGKGQIVYRNRNTGEVVRKVDAVPNVYDPVTVAYYFRSRDLGSEETPRALYAGRKLWTVAARKLGVERLETAAGHWETVLVQPVIMRDGRVEDKGTLRMWMTNDERRVPVRVYAKFRKILDWTLVGELVPDEKGG